MKIKSFPYRLKDGKYIIFSCGRLVYYKGFHVLIDSANYLPDNCIIHIAGDGKLHDKLTKQIFKQGLSEKVFLLGRISENQLEQEMQNCFVFCLPSIQRSEMYGVVQIEAFCHGKPVISTNIPRSGVSKVNHNYLTGYTVEINNPKVIADKINLLLDNNDLYETLCKNALERGKELSGENIIIEYKHFFESIIQHK